MKANESPQLAGKILFLIPYPWPESQPRTAAPRFGGPSRKQLKIGLIMNGKENFVYGLAGIMELFECSKSKALKLKKTTIAPAVYQDGRKILVDWRQALELVKQNTTAKNK